MADDEYFYWSCNMKKFMKISSNDNFVERLGYKLNTEWYLEIKTKIHDRQSNKQFETTSNAPDVLNYSNCKSYPIWNLYLRRKESLRQTCVKINFFNKDNTIHRICLEFKNEESIHCGELNFKDIVYPCLDLVFVFQKEESITKVEKVGFSKLSSLSGDFQLLLNKENRFDVALKCEEVAIKAHKSVLAARSPVFEAMFNSDMKERDKDEVMVEDMNPSVLRTLVSFIYRGVVEDLNFTTARDLLYASEKYQIESLKEGCVEYLQSILSNENIFEIVQMGDLCDENLKSISIDYVIKNFNQLKVRGEWKIIKKKNPLLAMEIYSCFEPFLDKNS